MRELLELVDHFDLSEPDLLKQRVKSLTISEITTICESFNSVIPFLPAIPSNFNFFDMVVSSSMGAQHGVSCEGLKCRLERLYKLAVFSVLYSDQVYIPNFFSSLLHRSQTMHEDTLKELIL